jgi:ACS family tartrate transporter-like MFS transporter
MSASVEISELERRTLSKVKRYMFLYIVLGQIFYQFDRTNIGFAHLTMGKDLALNAQAFGLASGIFALSAFLMQVPAGLFFEKFGARRWLTFIMVGWGLVSIAQAFVTSGVQLTILRFLLGLFEAGFLPGVYILISLWFKGKHHGEAISCVMIGLGLSGILGGPFAGWVLGTQFFGFAGWRSLFLIDGILTVIWALIALLIITDGPEKAFWLKPEERKFMVNSLAEYQVEKNADGVVDKSSLWGVLKDSRIITLLICYALTGWVAQTLTFFIPTLLKRAGTGLSNQTVGFLVVGPYIVTALVAFTWGKHADRTEPTRHWHSVMPILASATAITLFPIATAPLVAMLCLAMVQGGNAGWFVNFWPVANKVVGKKTIAKSTAIINSANQAASFVGPIFFGWALDVTGNPNLGLYTAVGMLLVIFVLMNIFFFRHKAQLREKKQVVTGSAS